MPITKAVITAAGWGTRFLPATKSIPKEMVPVVDRPAIHYVVQEAVESGIRLIVLVTAPEKKAIEDYFDRMPELERLLEAKGDMATLAEVRRPAQMARFCAVRQQEKAGLGHAVLAAREVIGNEFFAVLLPDDLIDGPEPCLRQMLRVHEQYGGSVVAVERVPREAVSRYGIVAPELLSGRVYRLRDMVEKPSPENAPSDLAIVGRYLLSPRLFDILEHTPAGRGNEIQLTDGIRALLREEPVYALEFEGQRHDTGNKLGFLKATVSYALRHPELGPAFRDYLCSLNVCHD
jgi:UTP--glucose-1-phosphate uridylyltransferase